MHVYKNIAVHVYVLYDIYTLSRLRDFFHIYDLPMLTYTKCTYTCNFTRIWALVFLYMYNFIKSYTKYLQVYIRGLCHLYEVLLYVKKVARIRNRSFRIRFQVFVYVKKCASTKWCLYEVKSLTDESPSPIQPTHNDNNNGSTSIAANHPPTTTHPTSTTPTTPYRLIRLTSFYKFSIIKIRILRKK